jgi:hypothetical protein
MELYEGLNKIHDDEFETICNFSPIEEYLDIKLEKNIKSYNKKVSPSCFIVQDGDGNEREAFVKYITLVDYVKYLVGKYKDQETSVLPCKKEDYDTSFEKNISMHYNYAYVDTLFYYLSNKIMKENPNFRHGIECYDTFITMKNNCRVNIADDFEYLADSTYMIDNMNKRFLFEHEEINNMIVECKKSKISIEDDVVLNVDSIDDDDVEITVDNLDDDAISINELKIEYDDGKNGTMKSLSTQGSDNSDLVFSDDESLRGSINASEDEFDNSPFDDIIQKDDEEESDDDSSTSSDTSEIDELYLVINKFPVQVAVIEKCTNTLDSLLEEDDKDDVHDELKSCMFQILITLLIYQNKYDFTHNDLHTNNIMYKETNDEFLYYKIFDKYYKIPTYGKIYKIIDFGRSIYKVNGKIIENDSFSENGTAYTQYNFGTFNDESKANIEPNKSFDLCRLACSLFDFICSDIKDVAKSRKTPLYDMIIGWLYDDHGKNVLYKTNGEERYPGFKLYKMISRHVHKHLPENQFDNPCWNDYIMDDESMCKNICDVDSILN